MENYIKGCLIGLLYVLIGSLLIHENICVLSIIILLTSIFIFLIPYRNNKSLYLLFLENIIGYKY